MVEFVYCRTHRNSNASTGNARQCRTCGKEFRANLTGRRKTYCSDRCRLEAHRTNKISFLGHGGGLQRNDEKNPCTTGTFLTGFAGRGSGIEGPRHVIEAEIGGRNWIQILSADGVRSFVRPPRGKVA